MKNDSKIYVDKKGYEAILKSIEDLKEELVQAGTGRREAFDAGAGDGWDSPEFEEIERTERLIAGRIKQKYEELSRVVIVEKNDQNNDQIDIGDIVTIDMSMDKKSYNEMTFLLVGGAGDIFAEVPEVSLNSPLGKSVYHKKVGDEVSYTVSGETSFIKIKDKEILEKNNTMKK